MSTLYDVLDVPVGAAQPELKKAYRRAVMASHPDRGPGREELFLQVQSAWAVLGDQVKRAAYDARLAGEPPPGIRVTYGTGAGRERAGARAGGPGERGAWSPADEADRSRYADFRSNPGSRNGHRRGWQDFGEASGHPGASEAPRSASRGSAGSFGVSEGADRHASAPQRSVWPLRLALAVLICTGSIGLLVASSGDRILGVAAGAYVITVGGVLDARRRGSARGAAVFRWLVWASCVLAALWGLVAAGSVLLGLAYLVPMGVTAVFAAFAIALSWSWRLLSGVRDSRPA